jgi:Xaa-Pro aminopeptidase
VAEVADFLTSHAVKDGHLVKPDSQPLRIGEVKNRINLWLAERGAENPEDTIFAIGRDAGVPHSSGIPEDEVRLGQTIVFDIYPCQAGGGYYYDFTRTWCLGYAPDEAMALYEQVHTVYTRLSEELTANTPCAPYQRRTCELFEAQGHPTVLSQPETEEGYVHSLGHGVGLNIHKTCFYLVPCLPSNPDCITRGAAWACAWKTPFGSPQTGGSKSWSLTQWTWFCPCIEKVKQDER